MKRGGVFFNFITGHIDEVALFKISQSVEEDNKNRFLIDTEATKRLRSGEIKPDRIADFLESFQAEAEKLVHYVASSRRENYDHPINHTDADWQTVKTTGSLMILTQATKLYDCLPGTTVSISILNHPLIEAKWHCVDASLYLDQGLFDTKDPTSAHVLLQSEIFACIAMFESGNLNLATESCRSVMAMSSGNSIFTVSALLNDPTTSGLDSARITRILGNLNRPGIVMLVPPLAPLIKEKDPGAWRVINHSPFDGKPKDCFEHTSLHLSFTQYDVPLIFRTGAIDSEITILEALVSVYDRQKWVADIDVASKLDTQYTEFYLGGRHTICHTPKNVDKTPDLLAAQLEMLLGKRLISIDSWEELLDPPENLMAGNLGVLRAVGNWQARLAAFSICLRLGYDVLLRPATLCLCDECVFTIPLPKCPQILIL